MLSNRGGQMFSLWPLTHKTDRQLFNSLFSRSASRVSRHQKDFTTLDVNEAGGDGVTVASAGPYANICTMRQTDNHASTSSLNFVQVRWSFCCPTNSIKAKILQIFWGVFVRPSVYRVLSKYLNILTPVKWTSGIQFEISKYIHQNICIGAVGSRNAASFWQLFTFLQSLLGFCDEKRASFELCSKVWNVSVSLLTKRESYATCISIL